VAYAFFTQETIATPGVAKFVTISTWIRQATPPGITRSPSGANIAPPKNAFFTIKK